MTANNAECKDKKTALLILETIMQTTQSNTQRAALEAVRKWVKETFVRDDIFRMTREERETRIKELLKKGGYIDTAATPPLLEGLNIETGLRCT
jgi:hypothetical protein